MYLSYPNYHTPAFGTIPRLRFSSGTCHYSSQPCLLQVIPYHHPVSSSRIIIPYHHPVSSSHIIISYHHRVSSSRIIIPYHNLIIISYHHLISLSRIIIPYHNPLSSGVFGLLCNTLNLRFELWSLINIYQRPLPKGAEDIGTWQIVFTILMVASVVTNAGIAVFTMSSLNRYRAVVIITRIL